MVSPATTIHEKTECVETRFDVLTDVATVAAMPTPWLKPKTPYPFQKPFGNMSRGRAADQMPSAYHINDF